jgi:hypothetical protein
VTAADPPVPRSAHRLVLFVVDGGRCADPAVQRQVEDAVVSTMVRVEAGPGAADHHFAVVVYGDALVRAVSPATLRPWDLRVPCTGAARTDGATAAIGDLAAQFLAGAPDGLPGSVDVLALVSPGAHVARPDDLRILSSEVDDITGLADEWWARLAEMRSQRRHTVLLR